MRLQRISFSHSDIPPGLWRGDCRSPPLRRLDREWAARLNLEFAVLWPTNHDRRLALDPNRGNEPSPAIADLDEDEFAPGGVEALRDLVPALIAAAGANGNRPV